jgi:excisionase family DNA binding protein
MRLVNATIAKEILGLSSNQRVYELARLNWIPSVRLGRQVRFDPAALEEWAKRGGTQLNGNQQASDGTTGEEGMK